MLVVDSSDETGDERLVHALDDIAHGLRRSRVVLWIIAMEVLVVLVAVGVLIVVDMFR